MKRFSRLPQKNNIFRLYLIALWISFAFVGISQNVLYTSSVQKDIFHYRWKFMIQSLIQNHFYVNENRFFLSSQMFTTQSTHKYFNDDIKFYNRGTFIIHRNLKIKQELNYNRYKNDQLNLQFNKVSFINQFEIHPHPSLILAPLGGGMYREKYSFKEKAFSYGILGQYQSQSDMNHISLRYKNNFDQYQKSLDKFQKIEALYFTRFMEGSEDSLYYGFSVKNYSDYFNQDLDLEKIKIKEHVLKNHLTFLQTEKQNIHIITSFKNRSFNQNRPGNATFRNETEFINDFVFQYKHQSLDAQMLIRNYYVMNDFKEDFLDNEHVLFVLQPKISYNFNKSHQISWNGYYSKLEYNTPDSTINFDDRDEMRMVNKINYSYTPRKNLIFTFYVGGSYYYHRYIYKQRSALNNKEIILSMGTETNYQSGFMKNNFRLKISSYYVVYDYSRKLINVNNIMNRKLILDDSLSFYTSPSNFATVYFRWEKEEIGLLDWQEFLASLERENSQNQILFFYQSTFLKKLIFVPGFSLIFRKDFFIPGTRRLVRDYKSKSFWIRVEYAPTQSKIFRFSVTRYAIDNINVQRTTYLIGNVEVVWNF